MSGPRPAPPHSWAHIASQVVFGQGKTKEQIAAIMLSLQVTPPYARCLSGSTAVR